jgi:hypothetical protein
MADYWRSKYEEFWFRSNKDLVGFLIVFTIILGLICFITGMMFGKSEGYQIGWENRQEFDYATDKCAEFRILCEKATDLENYKPGYR